MTDQAEVTLEELLREPIILEIMARDGVHPNDIRHLMQHVIKSRDRTKMNPTRQMTGPAGPRTWPETRQSQGNVRPSPSLLGEKRFLSESRLRLVTAVEL